ncbi:CAP Gly-rich domain-containing protein [Gautieria morchelliformis]|nr:CAP Gly-rich domain-containing protein [Gautieria morchelliformis]
MSSSTVTVFVASPDTRSERRYDLHITIELLKMKLESVTGIPIDSQRITLHNQGTEENESAEVLAVLDDDRKSLGYYNIRDWQVLKVKDTNPATASLAGQYTDVSRVEKFEISEEEYAARQDTVLAYKQAHKVGRFARPSSDEVPETSHIDIPVGSRCEVDTGESDLKKRGTVRFVGPTKFAKGVWVGVEYDEPLGKNDGSVQRERYFTTRQNYGGFVRPDRLRLGDFPVEELGVEDDEM